MAGDGNSRGLAAILAADVAGYSRIMGADGAGTLKHHTAAVFDLAVSRQQGRVKLIDDSTLVGQPPTLA